MPEEPQGIPLDAEQLASFAIFAEELSFTAAAARLHLSQPAVHKQVQRLSEAVGVPLYERHGRRLELTAAGQGCAAFARERHRHEAAFLREVQGRGDAQPLTFAAGEGALLYLLGDALTAYQKAGPTVAPPAGAGLAPLRVLTRDRDGTLDALRKGEAQIGVSSLAAAPEELETQLIARVTPQVALPRGHSLARKRRLSLLDLDDEALILPPPGRPHREAVSGAMAAVGAAPRSTVEAHGWPLMLHFVRLGLGLAVVNGFCRAPAGVYLRPLRGMPARSYQALRRRGATLGDAGELLWRLLASKSRFRPIQTGAR